MIFNDIFFITLFASGIALILAGLLQRRFPPIKRNGLYGYRSVLSRSSEEYWNKAQKKSQELLIKIGLTLCLISPMGLFIEASQEYKIIAALIILTLGIVAIYILTEKHIKK